MVGMALKHGHDDSEHRTEDH